MNEKNMLPFIEEIPEGVEDSENVIRIDNDSSNTEYLQDFIIRIPTDDLMIDYDEEIEENVFDPVVFNKTEFQKGLDSISQLAGKITGLVNVGITPSHALNYLSEIEMIEKTLNNNVIVSKINSETNKNSYLKEEIKQMESIL